MKKTTRLVISLCMVALSVFILCFGVWAAVVAEYKITGKVSYSVDNVNMRFQIEASISNASSDANENVEISNSTFSYSNASDINEVLNSWNLGSIYFIKNYSNGGETLTVPDIVITIKVTNLSSNQPMYVKYDWQTDDDTQFDTTSTPKANAKITLQFQKQVNTGTLQSSTENSYTDLTNLNSSVTYKLTMKLKSSVESLDPLGLGFAWNFNFDAIK